MQSRIERYINEIVSLGLMALMIIALVTGEAGAHARAETLQRANIDSDFSIHRTGELQ